METVANVWGGAPLIPYLSIVNQVLGMSDESQEENLILIPNRVTMKIWN